MQDTRSKAKSVALEESIKNSSNIKRLQDALSSLERIVKDRHKRLLLSCKNTLRLVANLERHTLHGLHIVASRSGIGLLLKIRENLEAMAVMIHGDVPNGFVLQQLPVYDTLNFKIILY